MRAVSALLEVTRRLFLGLNLRYTKCNETITKAKIINPKTPTEMIITQGVVVAGFSRFRIIRLVAEILVARDVSAVV